MIELRWLHRVTKVPTGATINGTSIVYDHEETVLQYRESPQGTIPPNVETLWIDVPTVSEDGGLG